MISRLKHIVRFHLKACILHFILEPLYQTAKQDANLRLVAAIPPYVGSELKMTSEIVFAVWQVNAVRRRDFAVQMMSVSYMKTLTSA
jgi:hypothetical protein